MEIWDLYNENRELTGETHIRGQEIPNYRYHLVVHVWIRNDEGQYLISQRAADRPAFPLMYECVGGSALAGESSIQAAVREVKEEVGIDLCGNAGKLIFSTVRKIVNGKKFNDILDVWEFSYNGAVKLEEATTDEVASAEWMGKPEILQLYKSGKLVPTLDYFFGAFV